MRVSRFFTAVSFSAVLGGALLSAAQGAERGGARHAAPAGAWQIEAVAGKRAAAGMSGAMPEIEFAAGSYHGQSGCNGFGGSLAARGRTLKFGRPRATLMACPEPLMKQEAALFDALSKVSAYRYAVSGRSAAAKHGKAAAGRETLRLLDSKGRAVIVLARK